MSNPRSALQDDLLVLACKEGDAEAFLTLASRWQEPLWRHAYRLTGDHDGAWDVLQDTWLGIARGIHRLRDPATFRSWAYTIVTRRAADWVATQRDRAVDSVDGSTPAPAPEADAEPGSAVEALRRALQRLPGEPRALLSLRYVDEFELAEIAVILGVPEGTVKSRLHHARAKLREIIERMQP